MRRDRTSRCGLVAWVTAVLSLVALGSCSLAPRRGATVGLWSNESFVAALARPLDVTDPSAVFEHVWSLLPPEIVVRPSEGYYYLRFQLSGRDFRGSLNFYADTLAEGWAEFSYEEITVRSLPGYEPVDGFVRLGIGGRGRLRQRDGARVVLEYGSRSVTVRFPNPARESDPPLSRRGESYVGRTLDESGIEFHLFFSEPCGGFLWVLDETGEVSEPLVSLGEALWIGARTGFAYHEDRQPGGRGAVRRVLVGISALEERRNSWYDGPFDQLPDPAIRRGEVDLRTYFSMADGSVSTEVDSYGIRIGDRLTRVAITPYLSYTSVAQLVGVTRRARAAHADADPFCPAMFGG